jgi:hypothetical protein
MIWNSVSGQATFFLVGQVGQVIAQNKLPSGYVKIAIENGHRNSEFSH